ncbi:MAG TPA: mobile mystery protein A [Bdellovibrio sp.]|uniref:mobile mystery protein A n=1 Tax=Bdellovibrio sp. TaxID=28201 RepID=UPI002EF18175
MTKLISNSFRRTQLDRKFADLKSRAVSSALRPKEGWVKEVRNALGMSMSDLAKRIGVIPARISRIEKDEVAGKVTLETMNKVAEAMNCEFVYFIIPKSGSLEATVNEQAERVASKIVGVVDTNMKLENQGTSSSSKKDLLQSVAIDILTNHDRKLWK